MNKLDKHNMHNVDNINCNIIIKNNHNTINNHNDNIYRMLIMIRHHIDISNSRCDNK